MEMQERDDTSLRKSLACDSGMTSGLIRRNGNCQGSFGLLRLLSLLVVAGFSAIVALGALAVLMYVLLTHVLTPYQLRYDVTVPFEWKNSSLTAEVALIPSIASQAIDQMPEIDANAGKHQGSDTGKSPKKRFDVDLVLQIPKLSKSASNGFRPGFFHVSSELRNNKGRSLARSTQGILLHGNPSYLSRFLYIPFLWQEVFSDRYIQVVSLFSNYEGFVDLPCTFLSVMIESDSNSIAPVLEAHAVLRLRVNFLQQILFFFRPHYFAALSLGCGATFVSIVATIVSGIAMYYFLTSVMKKEVVIDNDSNDEESEENLSDLLDGTSTALTDTPRNYDEDNQEILEETD